jgi:hypothetical protein
MPLARATRVAAGIPIAMASAASRRLTGSTQPVGRKCEMTIQTSSVAKDPQVPGPGFNWPAPKNVATRLAQRGVEESEGRGGSGAPGNEGLLVIGVGCGRIGLEIFLRVAKG